MAQLGFDLNQEPPTDWGLNGNPIDWDAIDEWEGPAHELDYHLVWDDVENGDS